MSDVSRLREIVEEEVEKREELRDEISFDQCEQIKEVGEFYRDSTLSEAAREFDISRSDTRELVIQYVKLVNYPTARVTWEAIFSGVQFYGGQNSFDEIVDESESSAEEVRMSIREFVGMTLAEENREIDLRSVSIFEGVKYPEGVVQSVDAIHETVNQVSRQVAESIQPVAPNLTSMFQDMIDQFRPLIQQLQEFAREVREAIEEGISNFEEPSNYDPEIIQLNSVAQAAGTQYLDEVLNGMANIQEHPLDPYYNRLERGIEEFRDGRFLTPVFSFISVQDGIMHWLCEQENVSPDYMNRFGDPVYKWDTKRNKLAELHVEWYGVSTGNFINNLESFYAHRNAIMHGDPVAFFDENIATISLLFLSMTLDTALNYSDQEIDFAS
ncbi:hypothetical protein [Salinarchaeum laminariae]|uniref:hypothetical protein n=1 Tax=Salinarchaeum laminariae TaxID=869888 RepID=UPI0020C0FA2A|nr:hypothetical protein [Salinarchaeum laminariae]